MGKRKNKRTMKVENKGSSDFENQEYNHIYNLSF